MFQGAQGVGHIAAGAGVADAGGIAGTRRGAKGLCIAISIAGVDLREHVCAANHGRDVRLSQATSLSKCAGVSDAVIVGVGLVVGHRGTIVIHVGDAVLVSVVSGTSDHVGGDDIFTTHSRDAGVIGAGIFVIALGSNASQANAPIIAIVRLCAWVPIITTASIEDGVDATFARNTGLQGACVSVVLAYQTLSHAFSVRTGVVGGTGVSIGAYVDVVEVDTSLGRITAIVRSHVSVVA